MKCHCKLCIPRFFCQTLTEHGVCYYRHAIRPNTTDDFGCFQSDVAQFLCNKTDGHFRTECCSTFFCNMYYRLTNETTTSRPMLPIESQPAMPMVPILVVSVLVTSLCLIMIFSGYFYRRFLSSTAPSSTKKTSTDFISIADHSNELSWNSDSSALESKNLPLEPRRINKEITFLGQLGQGRHARVRLGLIGQQYRAIKLFPARNEYEFERERAIFQTDLLQHPNILGKIIAFYGSDFFAKATDTFHMLIFEWHPYGTLHDVLKENPSEQILMVEQVFRYAISLADGLAHLHAIKFGANDICKPKMAHCDLKSSNILVKLNGDCCLADFSLAVRCHPQTQEILGGGLERLHHRVGTKLYMPPELLDPNPTKFHFDRIQSYQQADVYSLALVIWEIAHCFQTRVHSRPYENQLPENFTVEQLLDLICRVRARPTTDEFCYSSDQQLVSLVNLLDFYWCDDPCARHSAANLQEKLRQLRQADWNF